MTDEGVDVEEAVRTEPRRRGRRPHSVAESAQVRDRILAAFADEFAHTGYHGLTVALVLDRAGISRGTYYRYFRDLDEPMSVLLDRVTEQLIDLVSSPVHNGTMPLDKITGAVDGYLEWGRLNLPLLPSLHAGLHDPSNPVSSVRTRMMGAFVDLFRAQFEALGLTPPGREALEVLVNTLEFTCYHHHLNHPENDAGALARARETMFRMTISILTPPSQWKNTAAALGISD